LWSKISLGASSELVYWFRPRLEVCMQTKEEGRSRVYIFVVVCIRSAFRRMGKEIAEYEKLNKQKL
jgi:hypothetical protein